MNTPDFNFCQRWRNGRTRYRPAGEIFDPGRVEIVTLPESDARAFVVKHHYSHAYPAARFRVGLVHTPRLGREHLAGVAVFSVPMTQAVIPKYLNVAPIAGVELGRFVLLDELAANAETYFLARAFKLLRRSIPSIRGVVSYSDPLPRYTGDGTLVKPGHVGTIYKAHNGHYHGRSGPRTLIVAPDGRVVSERSLSKIRNGESGSDYATRQLAAMGAPPRRLFEDGAVYVARALQTFPRVRHPGNHVFSWRFKTVHHRAPPLSRQPEGSSS
ncbi:MAG: hypothetical protein OEL20_04610 [Sulfuritalea sp.]|nr:hypothetical protein [Sulfuritalea sp.]